VNILPKKKMMILKRRRVIQVWKIFFSKENEISYCLDVSENLGTDEESGKSWSELEEEARKG
jgi:hypothetical protein